jgi:hypothetical protein
MTAWLALMHLVGLLLPAVGLATWMTCWDRVRPGKERSSAPVAWQRFWLLHFGVGVLVLVLGLAVFGRDGKMLSYAALVVASGTLQWALRRGWKP